MGRTCPKNAVNVKADVIKICELKFAHAVRESKANQNLWHAAVQALQKSQDDIWVQQTGEKKGSVVGLPKEIKSELIRDYLKQIADGRISIDAVEYDLRKDSANALVPIEEMKIYKTRNYGDSIWVLLAALYRNHQGFGVNMMTTQHLQGSCAKNNPNNHQMAFDHKTRKQGVWKAVDGLVKGNWLVKERAANGQQYYGLSDLGFKLAQKLFTQKFHPSISAEYALIEPKTGYAASAQGTPFSSNRKRPPDDDPFADHDYDDHNHGSPGVYDAHDIAVARSATTGFIGHGSGSSSSSAPRIPDPFELRHRRVEKLDPEIFHRVETYRCELSLSLSEAYMMVDSEDRVKLLMSTATTTTGGAGASASAKTSSSVARDVEDDYDEELALAISASIAEGAAAATPRLTPDLKRRCVEDNDDWVVSINAGESSSQSLPRSPARRRAAAATAAATLPVPVYYVPERKTRRIPEIDLTYDSQQAVDIAIDVVEVDLTASDSQPLVEILMDDSDINIPPAVHVAKEIWMVVDTRERNRNTIYTQLLENARVVVKRRAPSAHVTRASLNIADFQWCVPPASFASNIIDEDAALGCAAFPLLVERKTLSDIIERSASTKGWSGDAAHFKQERAMRFCSLINKRAFLLLEGELTVIAMHKIQPRVGSHEDVENIVTEDAISQIDELIGCLMGVIARNIGAGPSERVLPLQATQAETSLLLAAFTYIASFYTQIKSANSFKDFNFGCRYQLLESDMNELKATLSSAGVSKSFIRIIHRRFGSVRSLFQAYADAGTTRALLLLRDLTHGGANLSSPTPAEDIARHNSELPKVYTAIMGQPPMLSAAASKDSSYRLEVQTSKRFHGELDCDSVRLFPEFFAFTRLVEDPNPELSYCKFVKTDRANNRQSAPTVVVSVDPSTIIGLFIDASDMLGEEACDYELVDWVWASVCRSMPQMVRKVVDSPLPDGQVAVVVIEAAGHTSTQGSRGRLATAHNRHLNEAGPAPRWVMLPQEFAPHGQSRLMRSVQRINTNSNYLLVLFIAHLSFQGVHVVQSRNPAESIKFVLSLLHESHRQALLNRPLS